MRASNKIFRQEVKFIAGAAGIWQLPKLHLPQIAFIGKSNVGKSSLINSLCQRKSLVRVSHTPGRTRQINFFSVADKFILVDLPGYGFAKVPGNMRKSWETLITHYLKNSETLKQINILIDARRGIKENDLTVMKLIQSFKKDFQLVFTKTDKAKVSDGDLSAVKDKLSGYGYNGDIIATSSKNGNGISQLKLGMIDLINKDDL